jgi:hypothetical protein
MSREIRVGARMPEFSTEVGRSGGPPHLESISEIHRL